jgi:hypothetical protein
MWVATFIAILFSVNFFLNLFWYSMFVLLVLAWKGPAAARVSKSRARFHATVIVTVVVLTLLGVGIDRSLLYEMGTGWLYFIYDGGKWAAAVVLVGLSVLACSFLMMRMRPRFCLLLAAGMMVMNLVWWGLIDASPFSEALCSPVLFLVLVPFVLYELDKWHRGTFRKGEPMASDIARHPDRI